MINLNRIKKKIIIISIDFLIILLSIWLSYCIRLGEIYILNLLNLYHFIFIGILGSTILWINNIYNVLLRFIDQKQFFNLFFSAFLISSISVVLLGYTLPQIFEIEFLFPRSIPFIFFGTLFILLTSFRFIAQYILNFSKTHNKDKTNVLIFGANKHGYNLYNSISKNNNLNILGFIDNDITLQKTLLNNKRVLGNVNYAIELKKKYDNLTVYINDPSISKKEKIDIFLKLDKSKINLRSFPSLPEISSNGEQNYLLSDLPIDILIGRKEKKLDIQVNKLSITNKNVLISGAGGSIGSELSRQVLSLSPRNMILLDNSEFNLFSLKKDINKIIDLKKLNLKINFILGSINHLDLMNKVFKASKIHTIFHAAAYKHVDLVEKNIISAINNNIFGTYNMVNIANQYNVKNFILISTDKAVKPTNMMGKTKRVSELIVKSLAHTFKDDKKFSIVRFGNVFESSGSVIQIFKQQIANKGPITITDKNVTRYFMTLKEAAQLVIEASSLRKNGNVFILDMGKPIKIFELAQKLIRFYGFNVKRINQTNYNNNDIEIKFIGLKKGEKLHEELSYNSNLQKSDRPKILIANEKILDWNTMQKQLKKLKYLLNKSEISKISNHINKIVEIVN